jgi:hypothetical protein
MCQRARHKKRLKMSKSFNKLERKIAKEYEKKGKSKARADYIARATAGKIARNKKRGLL